MSIIYSIKCPHCGLDNLTSDMTSCPKCATIFNSRPAIEPSKAAFFNPDNPAWGLSSAIALWIFSVVMVLMASLIGTGAWAFWLKAHGQKLPVHVSIENNPELAIISLLFTLLGHLITLLAAYLFVKVIYKQTHFWAALGWHWHPRFRLLHAIATIVLILIAIICISAVVPNNKSDMQKLFESSLTVRLTLAAVAVLTAPLVEEVIYRGILFAGLRKTLGMWPAIIGVSAIFLMVHLPQYWGAWGTITGLCLLSTCLTLVRAYTSSLLPSFAIHLMFNSLQALLIVLAGVAHH